jgi:threonine dehydrogenase-like Zn-dependent dehydrogenase
MQAARIHGPGDLRVDEVPVPEPGPEDALVRVLACGICGTDLGYVALGGVAGPAQQPMPLGHELCGVIERVGVRVRGLEPGQPVVVDPTAADNYIGNGGPEGGFAPWLRVRSAARGAVHPIPERMPPARGALVEPLAVALHAVNRAGVGPGDRVVVFGAGPIGLGVAFWLRRRGVGDVVAVDPSPARRALARRFGADATIDPTAQELGAALGARHGSSLLYGARVARTDVYVDAAGVAAVVEEALRTARLGARLVVVGVHKKPVAVDFRTVLAKELSIVAALAYPSEFPEVIAALADDAAPEAMISHRFDWSAFPAAFSAAQDAARATKVMVTFPAQTPEGREFLDGVLATSVGFAVRDPG